MNLTVPKGKIISGQLVSIYDGDPVKCDPDRTMNFYLYQDGTWLNSYAATVDAQGNWSITVAPDLTGAYVLSTWISSDSQTNIVEHNYYSSNDGQVCTSLSDASAITVGAEDVTDVKLYVETGWVLSGSILLPEGGYLTGGSVYVPLEARSAGGSYAYGSAEVGAAGGSYRIVVSKTEDTYTITMNESSLSSDISTNVYFGRQELSDVSVAGDTSGLDFTLEKAKAVITGTVYRPEGVSGYISLTVAVWVENGSSYKTYSAKVYISSRNNSTGFSIPIPGTETGGTYHVYYYVNSTVEGIVSNWKNVYVCQDGSLTTDFTQAGSFAFADNQTFSFTLMETEPFAKGRIYCPGGLTDMFTVYVDYAPQSVVAPLSGVSDSQVAVTVGPGYGQQDADGRWYTTYSLADPSMGPGSTYKLTYYVEDYSGLVDTKYHYLDQYGNTVTNDEAEIFTVPDSGANMVDFTPLLWDDRSENYILQSAHGIDSSLGTVTYTYTYPAEADSLTVTFSERTDTGLTINGMYYSSYGLAGRSVSVSGNTLTITMTPTNSSDYLAFGFAVTVITANGGGTLTTPAAPAVYTETGGTEEAVMSGVNDGEAVHVSLVSGEGSDTDAPSTLAGVIYDANGKMLDFVSVQVDLSSGSATASLSFEEYGEAATLKLLLTNGEWVPQMENLTFRGNP